MLEEQVPAGREPWVKGSVLRIATFMLLAAVATAGLVVATKASTGVGKISQANADDVSGLWSVNRNTAYHHGDVLESVVKDLKTCASFCCNVKTMYEVKTK